MSVWGLETIVLQHELDTIFSQIDLQNFWPWSESFGSQGFAVWDRNFILEKCWRHDVVVFDSCLWKSATLYTEKCFFKSQFDLIFPFIWNQICFVPAIEPSWSCWHAKSKFRYYNNVSSTFFQIQISISNSKALRAKTFWPRSNRFRCKTEGKTHKKPVEKRQSSTSVVAWIWSFWLRQQEFYEFPSCQAKIAFELQTEVF